MMLPFKRILCPTDFSDTSCDALHTAAELALYFRAELTVLHVVPLVPVITSTANELGMVTATVNQPEASGRTRREAEMLLAEVVRDHVPHSVTLHLMVVSGDPAPAILEVAAKLDADAVVIATQGRTGWRRFIFGSVAERVVRCAECPVLTIHGRQDTAPSVGAEADATIEA